MIVTINTDASYSNYWKVGAFAYWIRCDSGKISERGILKGKIEAPEEAELMAITKAIHRLSKSTWSRIFKIIINTDCLNVIHFLNKDSRKIKRYKIRTDLLQPIADVYFPLLKRNRLKDATVEFRHVKAHVKVETAKQYCNDWCDRAAKLSLSEAINSIQNDKETNQRTREPEETEMEKKE